MKRSFILHLVAAVMAIAMMFGMTGIVHASGKEYTVTGVDIYLALRTETAFRYENEIGKIYNGEKVQLQTTDTGNSEYWYVYAPTLGKYGYVNKNYLRSSGSSSSSSSSSSSYGNYMVSGVDIYLALRTETAYRYENEIGRIYNGETVQVQSTNTGNSEYWYVYAPTLGKSGYVNKNYLVSCGSKSSSSSSSSSSGCYYTVHGVDIYLALRTETAYRYENEIGRIYNGETVQVQSTNTGNSEYWYVYAPTLGKYGYVNKNYLR